MAWTRALGGFDCRFLPGESESAIVCFGEAADTSADQPEEGRGIFCVIEEVGEVESQEGEVIGSIYARVYIPQEPFVAVKNPLADRGVRWQRVSVVTRAKNGGLRDMDIVALVQLSFDIRYANNHGYIIPYIARPKPQGLAQEL